MHKNNFQAESVASGNRFEDLVEQELDSLGTIVAKNFVVPGSGCEADFVLKKKRITEYIECKGGDSKDKKRPGAQRTDNVKKAIANGALIKAVEPKSKYVVYFSAPPKKHSASDIMIKVALKHKIIDEIRYVLD